MLPRAPRKGQTRGQFKLPTRRQVNQSWVRQATQGFEETGNPVHAWDALATCLAARIPVPPAIREYLRGVAREMTQLSRKKIPSKGTIDKAVSKALGFSSRLGRTNPFKIFAHGTHEWMVAFEVYTCHTTNWANQRKGLEGTKDWNSIFAEVAVKHRCLGCINAKMKPVQPGTVKRYWYKHAMDIIPPHLIDKAQSRKVSDILR